MIFSRRKTDPAFEIVPLVGREPGHPTLEVSAWAAPVPRRRPCPKQAAAERRAWQTKQDNELL